MQGFVHYDLSLRDNVELGAAERRGDGAFFEKLRPGLDLDDLAARLPDGWNTRLGTGGAGGVNLSGGEWQRVGLARAMYAVRAGRTVVVLDEPTAHLDADAEARARAQLEAINAAATVIVVSHRLATVRHADQIVVLADGAVRERGTHETLMAAGGQYAHMYIAQSERYLADVPSAAR
jgi:ABC-type multidrug transport system fused ATPase/permease subunit